MHKQTLERSGSYRPQEFLPKIWHINRCFTALDFLRVIGINCVLWSPIWAAGPFAQQERRSRGRLWLKRRGITRIPRRLCVWGKRPQGDGGGGRRGIGRKKPMLRRRREKLISLKLT